MSDPLSAVELYPFDEYALQFKYQRISFLIHVRHECKAPSTHRREIARNYLTQEAHTIKNSSSKRMEGYQAFLIDLRLIGRRSVRQIIVEQTVSHIKNRRSSHPRFIPHPHKHCDIPDKWQQAERRRCSKLWQKKQLQEPLLSSDSTQHGKVFAVKGSHMTPDKITSFNLARCGRCNFFLASYMKFASLGRPYRV